MLSSSLLLRLFYLLLLSRDADAFLACHGGHCRYLTVAIGKIFHPGDASGGNDIAYSWSPETLPYVSLVFLSLVV